MRFEWHLLSANNHLGSHAVPLEKARQGCGTLKAKRLFPVPNAGHVHCGTDPLQGILGRNSISDGVVAHFVVQRRKIASR